MLIINLLSSKDAIKMKKYIKPITDNILPMTKEKLLLEGSLGVQGLNQQTGDLIVGGDDESDNSNSFNQSLWDED